MAGHLAELLESGAGSILNFTVSSTEILEFGLKGENTITFWRRWDIAGTSLARIRSLIAPRDRGGHSVPHRDELLDDGVVFQVVERSYGTHHFGFGVLDLSALEPEHHLVGQAQLATFGHRGGAPQTPSSAIT